MSSKEEQPYQKSASSRRIPRRIQWVAAAAGCFAGVALLSLSWSVFLLAVFLVLGAMVSLLFPRAGRWLVVVPALAVSAIVLPIFIANPVEMVKAVIVGPHYITFQAVSLCWPLSPMLLVWCDAALLIEAVKVRRAQLTESPSTNR
jgi:hypothetical protein